MERELEDEDERIKEDVRDEGEEQGKQKKGEGRGGKRKAAAKENPRSEGEEQGKQKKGEGRGGKRKAAAKENPRKRKAPEEAKDNDNLLVTPKKNLEKEFKSVSTPRQDTTRSL